jgi:hypothetical protein
VTCTASASSCSGSAAQRAPAAARGAAAPRGPHAPRGHAAPRAPLLFDPLRRHRRRAAPPRAAAEASEQPSLGTDDSIALPENFCIIESRDAVKDFASMQLDEIADNISARRNRIFLLMEEVRRLRIQQRLKVREGRTVLGVRAWDAPGTGRAPGPGGGGG